MSNISVGMSKCFALRWRLLAFNTFFLDFTENNFIYLLKKLNQSHYRPGKALGFPGV
jgi:hypothetical protein